ncbi:MAG: phytoene/squalene synthase family protein [Aggregatilineales bacterium]
MSIIQQSHPWELRLLHAAEEAFNSQVLNWSFEADSNSLHHAYQHCKDMTRQHSRTFFMASALLPPEKRHAARSLYAFCRISDDIVDDPVLSSADRSMNLELWRKQLLQEPPDSEAPVCLAWADTQTRFNIPRGYARQLIDGVARDIYQTRYETFEDLAEYSYGVASTVGLMAMHIIGFESEAALPYAVKLGVALQLTNILRDIGEDWRIGRVYLPQEDLHTFGLTEDDLAAGVVDDRWRDFMAFQIARTRNLYAEAIPGIAMLDSSGRFAIMAAARLYEAILYDIEKHDYDVFSRRAYIKKRGKMRRLPRIWWQSRRKPAI